MKVTSSRKCPNCGQIGLVINSNNVLSPGICESCLNKLVNYKDLKAANYFCRTYNIPFDPSKWIKIAEGVGPKVFAEYTQVMSDERSTDFFYEVENDNGALWEEATKI